MALIDELDKRYTNTKKQKLLAGTPLKHFLAPLLEEQEQRRIEMLQQMSIQSPMGQAPRMSINNPLQNALMNGGV